MATQKQLTTRVQNKCDTSANWAKATSFVPLKGEIIIYSDLGRIKVGDGSSSVTKLKFVEEGNYVLSTAAGISAALYKLSSRTSAMSDTDYLVMRVNGNSTYYEQQLSYLWTYIDDKVSESYIPSSRITYSTTDLTAGTSSLTTGNFYFVYE